MILKRYSLLLFLLINSVSSLCSQTTLKDVRHFFPEPDPIPVAGQYAIPQFYHGADLYSRPVEGPIFSKYALEIEVSPLFFVDRDASSIDGGSVYYGFTTSFGFPLARSIRPNHYVSIELLGAFDSVDIPHRLPNNNTVNVDTTSRMLSLMANYKWYTPPLLRDRIYPYINLGIGNSFKSIKASTATTTILDESDGSILTFQGGVGLRARITQNFGLRTGYHSIVLTSQDYGQIKEGADILHALDLGMSLSF